MKWQDNLREFWASIRYGWMDLFGNLCGSCCESPIKPFTAPLVRLRRNSSFYEKIKIHE